MAGLVLFVPRCHEAAVAIADGESPVVTTLDTATAVAAGHEHLSHRHVGPPPTPASSGALPDVLTLCVTVVLAVLVAAKLLLYAPAEVNLHRLRLIPLIAVAATITVVTLAVPLPTVAQTQQWIADAGPAGPALYLAAYLIGALLFVPRPVLTLLGGALFGPIPGAALALFAATAAALVAFLLARLLGRELVSSQLSSHRPVAKLDALLTRRGWLAVVYLRLLPVVPYGAVSYGCGLSALPATHFVLGTAIGSLPATILLATLGASLDDPRTPGSYLPIAIGALVGATAFASQWWISRRRRRHAPPSTVDVSNRTS